MKVGICAVGRMKAGPEKELADRYFDRFAKAGPALGFEHSGLFEIPESSAAGVEERRRDEALRLRSGFPSGSVLVVLDERGKSISSEVFASKLAAWRDSGNKHCALLIGGPDGHDPSMRDEASLLLSFGSMTWPHQLARIMLAEQLYRAVTILSGHPYHRA